MVALLIATLLGHAADRGEIDACIAQFNSRAVHELPRLDDGQFTALMRGEVVRTLHQAPDPDEPSAVVAFALSPVSRDALWIAAQDPHTKVDPGLTEAVMQSLGDDQAVWYGYWDLPRPLRDRQWVVASGNTHEVARATGGKGWEHAWALVEDGLDDARPFVASGSVAGIGLSNLESAVFTPINRGSWFMFELDDGHTLVGYQATSVVGGSIPTWLVTRLVMARMESLLRDLETRGKEWSPAHYRQGHAPVLGGDGEPIPRFDQGPECPTR